MIDLLKSGQYKLIETKQDIKVLHLDHKIFACLEPLHNGQILASSRKAHKTDCVLSIGCYHIYNVNEEPHLTDQRHLELEVGGGQWQGYLLLSGLPDPNKKCGRLIPTREIITNNPRFTSISNPRLAAAA